MYGLLLMLKQITYLSFNKILIDRYTNIFNKIKYTLKKIITIVVPKITVKKITFLKVQTLFFWKKEG